MASYYYDPLICHDPEKELLPVVMYSQCHVSEFMLEAPLICVPWETHSYCGAPQQN